MGEITYQPLRSLIYVDCVKEEYRHKIAALALFIIMHRKALQNLSLG